MLQFMRKHAKFFYVSFFMVIISFIFFYVGPIDNQSSAVLIEIGKKKIFIEEYWRIHDNIRNYYRNIYKDKFDPETEKALNLKQLTLDRIVDNELLLVGAKRLGISVSDDELNESIVNDPSFIRDGVFKKEIYLRILQFSRLTPRYFEAKRREELIAQKIRRFIGLSADKDVSLPEGLNIKNNLSEDKKTLESLRLLIINEQKEKFVRAYIETLKQLVPVKIRYELLT